MSFIIKSKTGPDYARINPSSPQARGLEFCAPLNGSSRNIAIANSLNTQEAVSLPLDEFSPVAGTSRKAFDFAKTTAGAEAQYSGDLGESVSALTISFLFTDFAGSTNIGSFFRKLDERTFTYSYWGGSGVEVRIASCTAIRLDTLGNGIPTRYTAVYDQPNVTLYRGLDTSSTVSDASTTTTATGQNTYLGQVFAGSELAHISDLRVYHRALSGAEVQAIARNPDDLYTQPRRTYFIPGAAAPPAGAIMNQLQGGNLGADLFNGTIQ